MRSLLNMAALRSLTVGLVACQLGSKVPGDPALIGEVQHGLAGGGGEPGALAGWVIIKLSRCDTPWCGGGGERPPLPKGLPDELRVSAEIRVIAMNFMKRTAYQDCCHVDACEFDLSDLRA